MRVRTLVLAGGSAAAVVVLYRRRRRKELQPGPDPAADLRRKLDESRALSDERDEFESAEVPVDQAEAGIDERRRRVHDQARTSIDDMRDPQSE
jgi:hypothetical protein